jgi:hypothetical protein
VGRLNGRRSARDALDALRPPSARATVCRSLRCILSAALPLPWSLDGRTPGPLAPRQVGEKEGGAKERARRNFGPDAQRDWAQAHGIGCAVCALKVRVGKTRECLRWVSMGVIEQP